MCGMGVQPMDILLQKMRDCWSRNFHPLLPGTGSIKRRGRVMDGGIYRRLGFCSNADVLNDLGVDVPTSWDDLLDPALKEQVAIAHTRQLQARLILPFGRWRPSTEAIRKRPLSILQNCITIFCNIPNPALLPVKWRDVAR